MYSGRNSSGSPASGVGGVRSLWRSRDCEQQHGGRHRPPSPAAATASARWRRQSCCNRYFLTHHTRVVEKGAVTSLELNDLEELDPGERVAPNVAVLEEQLTAAIEAAKANGSPFQGGHVPSMVALARPIFGRPIAVAALLLLFSGLLPFLGPIVLRLIIARVEDPKSAEFSNQEMWVITVALLVAPLVSVIAELQASRLLLGAGLRLKGALSGMVYRKALRLASGGADRSGAAIVNLMTTDSWRVGLQMAEVGKILIGPVQVAVSLGLIADATGASGWGGFATMLLLLPAYGKLGVVLERLQAEKLMHSDRRKVLLAEVVSAIRVVKSFVWEGRLTARIQAVRQRELEAVRKMAVSHSILIGLIIVSPMVAALVTFTGFTLTGGVLRPSLVFSVVSLLSLIRLPLMELPLALGNLLQARVSAQRILRFLINATVTRDMGRIAAPADPEVQVQFSNASFAWPSVPADSSPSVVSEKTTGETKVAAGGALDASDDEVETTTALELATGVARRRAVRAPMLSGLTMEVKRGKLTCIVGHVGAGCSSLLGAILGELDQVDGDFLRDGNVRYVPQTPWILNGTIRDNIVFGGDYDAPRLTAVVEACGLADDLRMLPGGEQCEIGERGVTLSGGQKQRVAIARAIYGHDSPALANHMFLLDDPLSACDVHVGRQIFERVIMGMLLRHTRVVVLNQLEFLHFADHIVVMRNGRIESQGVYDELVARGVQFAQLFCDSSDDSVESTSVGRAGFDDGGFEVAVAAIEEETDTTHTDEGGVDSAVTRLPSVGLPASELRTETDPRAETMASLGNGELTDVGTDLVEETSHTLPVETSSVTVAMGDASATPSSRRGGRKRRPQGRRTKKRGPSRKTRPERKRKTARGRRHTSGRDQIRAGPIRGRSGPHSSAKLESGGHSYRPASTPSVPRRLRSLSVDGSLMPPERGDDDYVPEDGTLVEEEDRSIGRVSSDVFIVYLKYFGGYWFAALAVLLYMLVQSSVIIADMWLALWSQGDIDGSDTKFLVGFAGFAIMNGLLTVIKGLTYAHGSSAAASGLHRKLITAVLNAPVAWFDTTPTGRILNRLGREIETVDAELPHVQDSFIAVLFILLGLLTTVAVIVPAFVILLCFILYLFQSVRLNYRGCALELQRLVSVTRSPVLQWYSESLAGRESIRACGHLRLFEAELDARTDDLHRALNADQISRLWLRLRLIVLGSSTVAFVGMFLMRAFRSTPAGFAGLAFAYSIECTTFFGFVVLIGSLYEARMSSVDRVLEYTRVPQEPATGDEPDGWPAAGEIRLEGVSMRYRPELPLVLTRMSLHIQPGEKIGICGRTGSGKSSLAQLLFRLRDPADGRVIIDGIDIASLSLSTLRRGIELIPQDATVFGGSVRSNLDPFEEFTDDDLWEALQQVNASHRIRSLGGLDAEVTEAGGNLSVGERQLVCIARSLLRRPRILVMDEATASVDEATDALLQVTVRRSFAKTSEASAENCARFFPLTRARVRITCSSGPHNRPPTAYHRRQR